MSGSLRYQQPSVREHLVSQYVLSTMSSLVRRRFERLMHIDPALENDVYAFREHINQLNDELSASPVPHQVWNSIEFELDGKVEKKSLWSMAWLWQLSTAVLLVFSLFISMQQPLMEGQKISYLAAMSATDSGASEPAFVIAAYAKTKNSPSTIRLSWNDRLPMPTIKQSVLWAVDRKSGKLTNLGKMVDFTDTKALTKVQWVAIKNSSELVIFAGAPGASPMLYRGQCLQLGG